MLLNDLGAGTPCLMLLNMAIARLLDGGQPHALGYVGIQALKNGMVASGSKKAPTNLVEKRTGWNELVRSST